MRSVVLIHLPSSGRNCVWKSLGMVLFFWLGIGIMVGSSLYTWIGFDSLSGSAIGTCMCGYSPMVRSIFRDRAVNCP